MSETLFKLKNFWSRYVKYLRVRFL